MIDYTNKKNQKYAIIKMMDSFEEVFKDHYIFIDVNHDSSFIKFDRKNVNFKHIVETFMLQYFDSQKLDVDLTLRTIFESMEDVHSLVYQDETDIASVEVYDVDLASDSNFVYPRLIEEGLADLEILMLSKEDKRKTTKKARKVIS